MDTPLTGVCEFCGQANVVKLREAQELAELEGIELELACNIVATNNCNCPAAKVHRRRESKLQAAGAWIENTFKDNEVSINLFNAATKAVTENEVNKVTVKIGKRDFAIDLDKDDCLRIKSKFTDKAEEVF